LFFNDFQHFLARLRRVLGGMADPPVGWHMPVAGTRFRLR
jgi:hypothetical protein